VWPLSLATARRRRVAAHALIVLGLAAFPHNLIVPVMFVGAGFAAAMVPAPAALGGRAVAGVPGARPVAGATWFVRLARDGAPGGDLTLLGLILALPVLLDVVEDVWVGEPMVADRMWILIAVAGIAVLLYQGCRAWQAGRAERARAAGRGSRRLPR
jgi:hypothetical protein